MLLEGLYLTLIKELHQYQAPGFDNVLLSYKTLLLAETEWRAHGNSLYYFLELIMSSK